MRTPNWEQSPGALAALFATGEPLTMADAWTITLAGGAVLRWSGLDAPMWVGPHYYALGPGITRSRIKWRIGISTDTLTTTLYDNIGTLINGQPLAAFIRAGGFVNARVQLDRVFFALGATTPTGSLPWFLGDVDDADGDRYESVLQVVSYTKRLEVAVPNGVYQTQCLNQVFDSNCGLLAAAHTRTGTAATGTSAHRTEFAHGMPANQAGWATLGVINFVSGANAGISRTCKAHGETTLSALQPWPFAVQAGDAFELRAGCDRLHVTCRNKFANWPRFRGTPFVPAAESVW